MILLRTLNRMQISNYSQSKSQAGRGSSVTDWREGLVGECKVYENPEQLALLCVADAKERPVCANSAPLHPEGL